MLLTAAWAGSLAVGKCDLDANGEAIEGSAYGRISCNKQVSPNVKYSLSSLSWQLESSLTLIQKTALVFRKGVHLLRFKPDCLNLYLEPACACKQFLMLGGKK